MWIALAIASMMQTATMFATSKKNRVAQIQRLATMRTPLHSTMDLVTRPLVRVAQTLQLVTTTTPPASTMAVAITQLASDVPMPMRATTTTQPPTTMAVAPIPPVQLWIATETASTTETTMGFAMSRRPLVVRT